MKIATKLNLSFLLLLFLPLALSAGFSLWFYSQKLDEEIQEKLTAKLHTAELIYQYKLEEMRKLAIAYASNPALGLLSQHGFLQSQLQKQLAAIEQNKNVDVASITTKPENIFAEKALNGEIVAGLDFQDIELHIIAAAPVPDRAGELVGALLISQSLEHAGLAESISKKTNISAQILPYDKDRFLPKYTKSLTLRSVSDQPIAKLIIQSHDDDFNHTRSTALKIFALISMIGMGLASLLRSFVSRSIIKPIHHLCQAAQHIKAGNFSVSLLHSRDELGALARIFCDMASSLKENDIQNKKLLESAAHGIAVLQKSKFVFVNTAFLNMLDREEDQILGSLIETLGFEVERIPKEWEISKGQWLACQQSNIIWRNKPAKLLTVQDITAQKLHDIERERELQHLQAENIRLRNLMEERHSFGKMIGKSLAMQKIYEQIPSVAASNETALLQGETGTGKGLLARTIHEHSPRKERPFILVNCGGITETLFEREFFGHVKDAFTGATSNKGGHLDAAQGGTLFLDEISELPLPMQIKLLHILDGDGFSPIGSSLKIYPDIRVIAATNQNLEQLIERKKMREDFYYRINIIPIHIPPLRERKEDIPLLINHFWNHAQDGSGQDRNDSKTHFPPRLRDDFFQHTWPGNVRELKNTILRLKTLKTTPFDRNFKHLHAMIAESKHSHATLQASLEAYEKFLIEMAISEAGGHREQAATRLGLNARTLYRRLKKFKIHSE